MAKMKLTKDLVEAAVVGGSVLGGGGGGSMAEGLPMAMQAVEISELELVDGEDLPDDGVLINVSAVGAPSAKTMFATPQDYADAVKNLCHFSNMEAAGIITNEMGGLATVNGWLQAALLGLPVVDMPSNGRAHPTGVMGAMGLHAEEGYTSVQAAIGGNPAFGRRVELVVRGTIDNASSQVRTASVLAGGFVAVARNPVTVAYAKEHSAAGAVKQALGLGQAMLAARDKGGEAVIEAVCQNLGAKVLHKGVVDKVELVCKGGFDVGTVTFGDFELTFWNEYMTAEKDGKRLGTFPELLMTLDAKTGWPVTSAAIEEGQEIAVICAPAENIHLGAGMKDPALFTCCEEAVGKEIISYAFK